MKPSNAQATLARLAGLTPEQRLIEASFAQQIADDPKKTVGEYSKLAVPEAGTPRYINTDLAREVFPPYANDKAASRSCGRRHRSHSKGRDGASHPVSPSHETDSC